MPEPLRYDISDWHQLTDVRSNNSRDLSIRVSDIIHSDILTGLRIRIEHKTFGTLFTYVVGASGSIISEPDSGITYELTKDQILAELARYGFLVTYTTKCLIEGDSNRAVTYDIIYIIENK